MLDTEYLKQFYKKATCGNHACRVFCLGKDKSKVIKKRKDKIMKSLIKMFGAVVCSTIIISDLHAGTGVNESTSLLTLKGGSGSYFSTVGGGSNQRWAGKDLGLLDLATSSDTLTLNNVFFENYAFDGGASNNNWLNNSNTAVFKIYRDSSLLSEVNMRQSAVSGNNRFWDLGATPTAINLLAGLQGSGSATARSLNWTIDWTYNQYDNGITSTVTTQATSGGTMTFQTVPEPSTGMLMGLGIAGLLVLRRIRKNA
jgi:hypothetical protein